MNGAEVKFTDREILLDHYQFDSDLLLAIGVYNSFFQQKFLSDIQNNGLEESFYDWKNRTRSGIREGKYESDKLRRIKILWLKYGWM